MSHEARIRAKLESAKHTKLNRYSEMHFDAPVRDYKRRTVLNALAHRRDGRGFVDALARIFTFDEVDDGQA